MPEKHLPEGVLEKIARDPDAPHGYSHLAGCAVCRQKLEFFIRFQAAFGEEVRKPVDPAVERIARGEGVPAVIVLRYTKILPDTSSLGIEKRILVLAAQGPPEEPARYLGAATFVSEPTKTLVRVVKDNDTGAYSLHVLTDFTDRRKHVILGIGRENEQPIFAVTDGKGIARIETSASIEWNSVLILLFPPIASVMVDRLWETPQRFLLQGLACEMKIENGVLNLRLNAPEGRRVHHVVAVYDSGRSELQSVNDGCAAFPVGQPERIAEIKFFS